MPGFQFGCGERGIRTLDTLLAYTHFPGVLLQPLGHLSKNRTAKVFDFFCVTKRVLPNEINSLFLQNIYK